MRNGGQGDRATAFCLDGHQWGSTCRSPKDTEGCLATEDLLCSRNGGCSESILRIAEMPTKHTLVSIWVRQASWAQIQPLGKDDRGVIPRVQDRGVGQMVPIERLNGWQRERRRERESDRGREGGERATDEEVVSGSRDWGELEIGAGE